MPPTTTASSNGSKPKFKSDGSDLSKSQIGAVVKYKDAYEAMLKARTAYEKVEAAWKAEQEKLHDALGGTGVLYTDALGKIELMTRGTFEEVTDAEGKPKLDDKGQPVKKKVGEQRYVKHFADAPKGVLKL